MMRLLLSAMYLAIGALSAMPACSADRPLSKLGFNGVQLNMAYSKLPPSFRNDCDKQGDRFKFCRFPVRSEEIPFFGTISLASDFVVEIHAYFPIEEYNAIWQALREKYGKEYLKTADKVQWRSFEPKDDPDAGLLGDSPDELRLVRGTLPDEFVTPPLTTEFPAGRQYGSLVYESLWEVNEKMRERERSRAKHIKGLSKDL